MRAIPFKASHFVALILVSFVCGCAVSEPNESASETANDLLHSDLPIFGKGSDNEWPQPFYDDESIGCVSRVGFGDWILKEAGAEAEGDEQWYRFSNYGVFHCWANIHRAYDRARLDNADAHPSFFVFLDTMSIDQRDVELWAIQIGARPGSEYLLLSRSPADGVIERFNVLQTACPQEYVRDAGSLDILLTRYCAVNSKNELVRLARRMARRAPLGTLTRVTDNGNPSRQSPAVSKEVYDCYRKLAEFANGAVEPPAGQTKSAAAREAREECDRLDPQVIIF